MARGTHIEDQEHGRRCPLGAASAHACGGPTDERGVPMLGRSPAVGDEDGPPGCGVHLGEMLVLRDPDLWIGVLFDAPTDRAADFDGDAGAVAEFAEHLALDVADQRVDELDDRDGFVARPVTADELARAVEYALGAIGVA
ncbi:hypothetical protein [Embleya sp. NPDC020630]|uniref:hypothetical protein n=1 Tax=Embleya sp. NPDC020630 TaxID=3363979 RepID=UPI003787CC09